MCIPQRTGNGDSNKYLLLDVQSNTIHRGQKMETTQMAVSRQMDEQIVSTDVGILFNHMKNEVWIHGPTGMNLKNLMPKVKEARQKSRSLILYNSTYKECAEQVNP